VPLHILLLAVGSMFWPLLLIVVVIALSTDQPMRILGWFYLGGMITTISVGAAVVFALQGSPLFTGRRMPSAPWVDLVIGLLALVAALALRIAARRRALRIPEPGAANKTSRGEEWVQRLVENGGPLAFAGGIVGSIVPSPLVLVALSDIAQLGYSDAATVLVIAGFYVIVFAFIEAPIAGYLVAPDWTKTTAVAANAWLTRNLLWLAVWALAIVGAIQVVRGIHGLLT
jgi:Sap, sulfolipid-1-addressing protein